MFPGGNFSNILNKVEIYINADIYVAYPTDGMKNNRNYTIEDVYNQAFGKGGELKRKIVGFYNEKKGYNVAVPRCKYCDRKNMTNVTLNSKVVVSILVAFSLTY